MTKKQNVERAVNKAIREHEPNLNNHGIKSMIRRSTEAEIKLIQPADFFKKMSEPSESRLYKFMSEIKDKSEEQLDTNGFSRIIEMNGDGQWRWKIIRSTAALKEMLRDGEKHFENFLKLKEQSLQIGMKKREDIFGGSGFTNDTGGGNNGAFPTRTEFMPLIGTPFYKQMYLYDYWEMHSKCFWYSNYSGIARLIVGMTRNFVIGKGFNIDFDDPKAQEAWERYEERSNIQENVRLWCDELTTFGEFMLKRIPTPAGIIHRSFDPSTVWEIVTDPENITDIKYYHQQYNTQYQIMTDKNTPLSKYIINQMPPQMVIHEKVNITSYEKRGRSDLLSALLYFKYYEDYTMAKLIRAKNEAAFIWDVEIDGSAEDVQIYINSTEDINDVPPGSENVHNKAITRTPLSPQFSASGTDETSKEILSYIAMSTGIPVNYMGTFLTGGFTKAGSLVATEPVAKKMGERQQKMEKILRIIVKDVMIEAGIDPKKSAFEINFPEIMDEDRSAKIQDLTIAKDNEVISHKSYSTKVAKELKLTKYDYEAEQKEIKQHQEASMLDMGGNGDDPALTSGKDSGKSKTRAFDRGQVKKDGLTI